MNSNITGNGRIGREARLGKLINEHLTQGSEQISYKAQLKLAAGRKKAVELASNSLNDVPVSASNLQILSNGTIAANGSNQPSEERFGWLFASIPALVLAAGLFGISQLNLHVESTELADEDVLLLTDDLPPAAYADHGFGVFIKNTRIVADDFSGSP